jgi:hypothetical protein
MSGFAAIDESLINPSASPADQAATRAELERRAAGGVIPYLTAGPNGSIISITPGMSIWDYDMAVTGRNKWLVLVSRPGEILLEKLTGKAYSGDMLPGPGQLLNFAIQIGVLYAGWKFIKNRNN